jgi:hypothetical protein
MPTLKTWHATYPRIGTPETIATVAELGDGSFLIAVAATGKTEDRRYSGAPAFRLYGTVDEAKARADAMVVGLLGRDVVGKWHGPSEG